jgi:hypothetical protein
MEQKLLDPKSNKLQMGMVLEAQSRARLPKSLGMEIHVVAMISTIGYEEYLPRGRESTRVAIMGTT